MNFKWEEFKDALLNRQGTNPILIAFGLQMVLGIAIGLPMVVGIGFMAFGVESGDPMAFMGMLGMLGLILAVAVPVGVYISAGMMGSLKTVVTEGRSGGFKDFMRNGKDYFWRMLGYSILMGVILMIIMMPLIAIYSLIGVASGITETLLIDSTLTFAVSFIMMVLYPLMYLIVFDGGAFANYRDFMKENYKPVMVVALVYAFVSAIPIVGVLLSITFIVYPLYILVLYVDYPFLKEENWVDSDEFEGEPVWAGVEDEDEKVTEEVEVDNLSDEKPKDVILEKEDEKKE